MLLMRLNKGRGSGEGEALIHVVESAVFQPYRGDPMTKKLHPAQEMLKDVLVTFGLTSNEKGVVVQEFGPFNTLVFPASMIVASNPKYFLFMGLIDGDNLVLNRAPYDIDLKKGSQIPNAIRIADGQVPALNAYMEKVEAKNPGFIFAAGEDEDGIHFNMKMEYPLSKVSKPYLAYYVEIYLRNVIEIETQLKAMEDGVSGPPTEIPKFLPKM